MDTDVDSHDQEAVAYEYEDEDEEGINPFSIPPPAVPESEDAHVDDFQGPDNVDRQPPKKNSSKRSRGPASIATGSISSLEDLRPRSNADTENSHDDSASSELSHRQQPKHVRSRSREDPGHHHAHPPAARTLPFPFGDYPSSTSSKSFSSVRQFYSRSRTQRARKRIWRLPVTITEFLKDHTRHQQQHHLPVPPTNAPKVSFVYLPSTHVLTSISQIHDAPAPTSTGQFAHSMSSTQTRKTPILAPGASPTGHGLSTPIKFKSASFTPKALFTETDYPSSPLERLAENRSRQDSTSAASAAAGAARAQSRAGGNPPPLLLSPFPATAVARPSHQAKQSQLGSSPASDTDTSGNKSRNKHALVVRSPGTPSQSSPLSDREARSYLGLAASLNPIVGVSGGEGLSSGSGTGGSSSSRTGANAFDFFTRLEGYESPSTPPPHSRAVTAYEPAFPESPTRPRTRSTKSHRSLRSPRSAGQGDQGQRLYLHPQPQTQPQCRPGRRFIQYTFQPQAMKAIQEGTNLGKSPTVCRSS
jgi:hypothetical protein